MMRYKFNYIEECSKITYKNKIDKFNNFKYDCYYNIVEWLRIDGKMYLEDYKLFGISLYKEEYDIIKQNTNLIEEDIIKFKNIPIIKRDLLYGGGNMYLLTYLPMLIVNNTRYYHARDNIEYYSSLAGKFLKYYKRKDKRINGRIPVEIVKDKAIQLYNKKIKYFYKQWIRHNIQPDINVIKPMNGYITAIMNRYNKPANIKKLIIC